MPVVDTVFSSPSDNLNGMSSELLSSGVLVDSAGVLHEIFVYLEGDLHWSVLVKFSLDLLNISWVDVSSCALELIEGLSTFWARILVASTIFRWGSDSVVWVALVGYSSLILKEGPGEW